MSAPIFVPIRSTLFDTTLDKKDTGYGTPIRPWSEFFSALSSAISSGADSIVTLTASVASLVTSVASLVTGLALCPSKVGSVTLTGQSSNLGPTTLTTSPATLAAGRYRLSSYARITAVASSSSLTVALGWTDGGVAQTLTGAAMTGNTTATNQSLSAVIRIDASSTLTYTTTYSTAGVGTMLYSLDIYAEKLP